MLKALLYSYIMEQLVVEFKRESLDLVGVLLRVLERADEGIDNRSLLEEYGQMVDRIMGGAMSLVSLYGEEKGLRAIGDYAAVCKQVGYKGSQIEGNSTFYEVVLAFLLDATEMLGQMLEGLGTDKEKEITAVITGPFLDRLRWVSDQFAEGIRGTVSMEGAEKKLDIVEDEFDTSITNFLKRLQSDPDDGRSKP